MKQKFKPIRSQLYSKLYDQIRGQTEDQLWYHLYFYLNCQMRNELDHPIKGVIRDETEV